jgi:predicted Fe-Mo cluster-binding NifX family protein
VENGILSAHFGHCRQFALIEVDPETKSILGKEEVPAPDHEPGLLPRWLSELGAAVVIAGGMGGRAQQLFEQNGIEVVVGASSIEPDALATQYLDGTLAAGSNLCDH